MLESYNDLERDVAIEIMGFSQYRVPYGNKAYVLEGHIDKWVESPRYLESLDDAVEVSQVIIERSEGRITGSHLELPCKLNNYKYCFKYIFKGGAHVAFECDDPCEAVCNLSLYVCRNVLRE